MISSVDALLSSEVFIESGFGHIALVDGGHTALAITCVTQKEHNSTLA